MTDETGSPSQPLPEIIYADAGDDGFRFIFPGPRPKGSPQPEGSAAPGGPKDDRDASKIGGLRREKGQGHLVTLVGRGGTGKSFLALQLITHLLDHERRMDEKTEPSEDPTRRDHAAFYFTLEASPRELAHQAKEFSWGEHYDDELPSSDKLEWVSQGLHVVSIPSPVADLSALILLLRQTIADKLHTLGRLTAIVVDPMGGVLLTSAIRNEISQLRELASSHHCFLLLLTERHLFERHHSIEHYSQTIIHLRHDPERQPYRWLHVQKSRSQSFRSGFHQVEFDPEEGLQIFPSIQAQSDSAHQEAQRKQKAASRGNESMEDLLQIPTVDPQKPNTLLKDEITRGSVVFLMGPPGTFKQLIATRFASLTSRPEAPLTIYISFKAEIGAVHSQLDEKTQLILFEEWDGSAERKRIIFFDARSPLLTPEFVLSKVSAAINRGGFSRAVVWGLRRLNDMPNFAEGRAVQFLEALVTLLRLKDITSLLVDWPDKERASTLPIVDLSQYILLTRVCMGIHELEKVQQGKTSAKEVTSTSKGEIDTLKGLWEVGGQPQDHVTFLRVQRTRRGFYRDLGRVFSRPHHDRDAAKREADRKEVQMVKSDDFYLLWQQFGIPWEEDPGLVN